MNCQDQKCIWNPNVQCKNELKAVRLAIRGKYDWSIQNEHYGCIANFVQKYNLKFFRKKFKYINYSYNHFWFSDKYIKSLPAAIDLMIERYNRKYPSLKFRSKAIGLENILIKSALGFNHVNGNVEHIIKNVLLVATGEHYEVVYTEKNIWGNSGIKIDF